MQPSDEYVTL